MDPADPLFGQELYELSYDPKYLVTSRQEEYGRDHREAACCLAYARIMEPPCPLSIRTWSEM